MPSFFGWLFKEHVWSTVMMKGFWRREGSSKNGVYSFGSFTLTFLVGATFLLADDFLVCDFFFGVGCFGGGGNNSWWWIGLVFLDPTFSLFLASTLVVVVVAVTLMVVKLMLWIGHRLPLMPYTLLVFLDREVYPLVYAFRYFFHADDLCH